MIFITDTKTLSDFCVKVANMPFVAIDTEFIREHTYYAQLCLIQVAADDGLEAIIDPLAKGIDLSSFWGLLQNKSVTKVFHACGQDIDIFYHLTNQIPEPLFDTQIAAMVCSMGDSVSYYSLCETILGVTIDKGQQVSDWSRRPLSEKQLGYALNDVTYLRDAYPKMLDMMTKQGRHSWVKEEMAKLTDTATYQTDPAKVWQKVKGNTHGKGSLSVLKEIAAWRENEAISCDRPRQWILRDEILSEIASAQPTDLNSLAEIRLIPKNFIHSRLALPLLDAVKRGRALNQDAELLKEKSGIVPKTHKTLSSLLDLLLKVKSKQFGVAPSLIASSKDLDIIAGTDNPQVKVMAGWRRDIFGADAMLLKQGKLKIFYDNQHAAIGIERTDVKD